MQIKNFNIRVYGLILNKQNSLLVSHETYANRSITKFVGGGLEKGEGVHNCLHREFKEELNQKIIIGELFYVNDFFQQSYFKKEDQIISIYYWVKPFDEKSFIKSTETLQKNQHFEWVELSTFNPNILSLPIDKIVIDLIKEKQ